MNQIIEASYPLTFREKEAKILGNHLKNRHSVVLIGMGRVGISSFLRYFLYHKAISNTFIADGRKHLFIPVDLNNLIEREIFPFWILTLKRIADVVEISILPEDVKKYIANLFSDSIQSNNLFMVIEGVRKALVKLIDADILPTIFFIRFDRMKAAVTPEFFDNLQGLKDATHGKLNFVFTSYRSLDKLASAVFTRAALSAFSDDFYILPSNDEDTLINYETYKNVYKLRIPKEKQDEILKLVDGYHQYLQLVLIFLHDHPEKIASKTPLLEDLIKDERINLQSEELWESLTEKEQNFLIKLQKKASINEKDLSETKYLLDTGFVKKEGTKYKLFSPLFEVYLKKHSENSGEKVNELSKKEHTLFNFLKANLDLVCEREAIIEAVWPEEDALGVTDWAIDRLVARLRNKLKLQESDLEIVTIKTRGYKMISNG